MDLNNGMSKKLSIRIIIPLLLLFFLGGLFTGKVIKDNYRVNDPQLENLIDVYQYLEQNWYFGIEDDEEKERMILNAITGMFPLSEDPHSRFSGYSEPDNSYHAAFGITIVEYNRYIRITKIESKGPAASTIYQGNSLQVGDLIIKINETEIKDYTTSQISSLFLSTKDETAIDNFIIQRDSLQFPMQIKAQANFILDTATGIRLGDDGIITIETFAHGTDLQVKNFLDDYKSKGVKTLHIDLRNNTGGYVDTVVNIANFFLPHGDHIATFTYKNGYQDIYLSRNANPYVFEKIFVYINGMSASASELLAGCLKDRNVATIVGEKSYGKGSAQTTVNIGNNFGSLTYTYALWETTVGTPIHNVGITPHYPYTLSELAKISLKYEEPYYIHNENSAIYNIKKSLSLLGYPLTLTSEEIASGKGKYDEQLKLVIEQFEQDYNLEINGIYDKQTSAKLKDLIYDEYLLSFEGIYQYAISLQ